MKRKLVYLILLPIFTMGFISGCDEESDNISDTPTQSKSEVEVTTETTSEIVVRQENIEPILVLDINDYGHSGRVWHDNVTEKYYYKGGQLCEIDMVDFASSYICDNEAYELNFIWCEIDEEISVYVDESMSADVAIEAIAGNTDVVLVSRILPQEGQTDFQLCDLKSQTVKPLLDDTLGSEVMVVNIAVSSDLSNAVLMTKI